MTAVIFDLDGTLIDSAPDIHAAANRALLAEGFAPLSLPQVQSFIGRGVPHLVARLLDASGEDPAGPRHAPFLARFNESYADAVGLTQPYPGVPAALDALVATGCRLGICTNKPLAPARAVLQHLGLADRFAAVIGGDSLAAHKPDPAPLLRTIADLGGGPAIFVGDSEVDAETAVNAGVRFVLYTEGYRKSPVERMPHQAAFADFAALPGLIRGMMP